MPRKCCSLGAPARTGDRRASEPSERAKRPVRAGGGPRRREGGREEERRAGGSEREEEREGGREGEGECEQGGSTRAAGAAHTRLHTSDVSARHGAHLLELNDEQ